SEELDAVAEVVFRHEPLGRSALLAVTNNSKTHALPAPSNLSECFQGGRQPLLFREAPREQHHRSSVPFRLPAGIAIHMNSDALDPDLFGGCSEFDEPLLHAWSLGQKQIPFAKELCEASRPAGQSRQHGHIVAVECCYKRNAQPSFDRQNRVTHL